MHHYLVYFCLILGILSFPKSTYSQQDSPKTETVKGSLVIVGGAMRDSAIFGRFLELAGGADAPIILIPAAQGDNLDSAALARSKAYYERLGATNITVLHTKDRELADSKKFIKPIKKATGVWFTGGRQWRIADSYLNTRTEEAFHDLLERGGVIGGSSAGATIQGEYLARGDTKTNTIMMGDHEEGFSFMPGTAIDQHLLVRNRQFDLIEIIEAKPELLGIGLDENTAIVVQGDEFEVIGQSFVAIYDHRLWDKAGSKKAGYSMPLSAKFFLLRPGDTYNFVKREMIEWDGRGRDVFRE